VVPPECGLLIANSIPDADLHLFGRCGHWVQSEQPRRLPRWSAISSASKPV
jgi:2-hydroxy-6-oxo-octa-2,4-dienoate hydrolase